MSTIKKKTRQYSGDYLKFGFITAPHDPRLPLCLLCQQTLSNEAMKANRLNTHFTSKHKEHANKPPSFFEGLLDKFNRRSTISQCFTKQTAQQDATLLASYEISHLIAKSGKPHTIGEELIKPSIAAYLRTVLHQDDSALQMMPLSNDAVRRRIDEMSHDVEMCLTEMLRRKKFSLQLDESTFMGSDAILMAYVRYSHGGSLKEEMLFAEPFETTTTGLDAYNIVANYFADKDIPMTNILSCAADGAPSMMGKHSGCLKYLKDNQPSAIIIHCVIHRENLSSKKMSPNLHQILQSVIKCVNFIKTNPKAERLFRKFCAGADKQHVKLIMHTEVRWLSKGNCLLRFVELYDDLMEFLHDSPELHVNFLQMPDSKLLVSYLADIFFKLNALNKDLQGSKVTLLTCKTKVVAFINKLLLYKSQLAAGQLDNFPSVSQHSLISDTAATVISEHLTTLHTEFCDRFSDLRQFSFPIWFLDPLKASLIDVEAKFQDELAELQVDDMAINLWKDNNNCMWLDPELCRKYPITCGAAEALIIPFPTTYMVESSFSVVNDLLTKKRNRLDIAKRGDLRLRLTSISPNIQKLAANHQQQSSH